MCPGTGPSKGPQIYTKYLIYENLIAIFAFIMSTLFFEDIVHWVNSNNTWIQIVSLTAGVIYILMQIFQHKWMWYFCIATALTALAIAVTNQNGSDWAPLWAQVGLNLYLLVISFIGIGRWRQLESESKGQIHIVKIMEGQK